MNLLEYLQRSGIPAEERALRGIIMRGDVLINDQPVTSPAAQIPPGATIRIRGAVQRPVSRGYDKLKAPLERSAINVRERVCADLGASTGGFTQCLVEAGARLVYAVDVGYGLLAPELRNNPHVVVLERTNARLLSAAEIGEPLDLVVGDLSFISWRAVVPAIVDLLDPKAELFLLIKPQFELAAAGKLDPAGRGIVRRAEDMEACLESLYDLWSGCDLNSVAVYPAGLRGAQGNQEFFIHLRRNQRKVSLEEYEQQSRRAVAEVAA
jgi:23S rRNA (cytidine1920-2'-O)/16S rRNA (cytidine1409-2'-O)-methyltransferase